MSSSYLACRGPLSLLPGAIFAIEGKGRSKRSSLSANPPNQGQTASDIYSVEDANCKSSQEEPGPQIALNIRFS